MAIGSKYWADSYIITTSGKKMYLSNSLYNLKQQMCNKKTTIEVETSNLYSKKFILKKINVEAYGEC